MINYLLPAVAMLIAAPAAAQNAAPDVTGDWWFMPTPGKPIDDRVMLIEGQPPRSGNAPEITTYLMMRVPDENNVIAVQSRMRFDCAAKTYDNRLIRLDKADGSTAPMDYETKATRIDADHSLYRFACLNDGGGLKRYGRGSRNATARRVFAELGTR